MEGCTSSGRTSPGERSQSGGHVLDLGYFRGEPEYQHGNVYHRPIGNTDMVDINDINV